MNEGCLEHALDILPRTSVILAMSADGKIADQGRSPARFGSPADQAHLEQRVAWADGVLFGAGTLRAYGTTMSVRSAELLAERAARGQATQPVQIVCSASGDLDPEARFFSQPVPRWLLTTEAGARRWERRNDGEREYFQRVWNAPLAAGKPLVAGEIDWLSVWRSLADSGCKRVAVLGGGAVSAAVFEAGLVQELWLTVCPLVLGGASSPTPVDGEGFLAEAAPRLRLRSLQQQGDEVFLHYDVSAQA